MNKPLVPLMKPKLPNLNLVAELINEMDQNRIYSNHGPILERALESMAKFLGVHSENLAFCSNATQGLSVLAAISNTPGFFVPDYSFIATPLAVLNANKKMQLCDVDSSFRIDLNKQDKSSGFGLMEVLPFGDNNLRIFDYSLFEDVIIDAAASLANFIERLVDIPKNVSIVFSLHATKILGIGEAGLIYSSNKEKIEKFRRYINFGFDSHRNPQILGTNCKLGEIGACYILAALENWQIEKDEWNQVNQSIFERQSNFEIPDITIKKRGINPYWIIETRNLEVLNLIIADLSRNGIESRKWWQSFHRIEFLQPYVNKFGYEISQKFFDTHLGLPKFRDMQENQVDSIFNSLNKYLQKY